MKKLPRLLFSLARIPALIGLLSALLLAGLPGSAIAQGSGWTLAANSNTPKWVGFSVAIGNKMYVFSGFDNSSVHTTPKCEVYDPAANTWAYLADMPNPVTHAGIATDGTRVYVAGGFLGGLPGDLNSDLLQVYDVPTNSWSLGPKLPARSGGNQLVRVGRKLHSFGGLLADRQTGSMAHYVLDLNNTAAGWTTATGMPIPRCHFAAANVAGKIYALGGQTGHDGPVADVATVQVYDPATDTWTQQRDMPYVRSHSESATFALHGKVTLAGGRSGRVNGADALLDKVTTYDPALDSWTEQVPLPVGLFGPAAEVIGSELIVANGSLNQTTNPQVTTRRIGWTSTPANKIGFSPATLSLSAPTGSAVTKNVILWTLSGNPAYSIDWSTVPAWLRLGSAATGTIDGVGGTELTITASAATLVAGTYSATITARAPGYPDATLPVAFTVPGVKPRILYLYGSIPPGEVDMKLSDTGSTGLSQFNQLLTLETGFSTTEALDASLTLTAATLNPYKVLILGSNNRRFTAAEQAAVATWVNAGGGLVAWSDAAFGWQNGGLNSLDGSLSDNDLTEQFGLHFLRDNGLASFTLSQWATAHYLNRFNQNGGLTIEAEGASPIRTSAPATIVANLPAGKAVLNSQDGPATAADAAMSVAKIGQGRVAGYFDRNAFWNSGPGTSLSRFDNRIFAQRLLLWAAGVDDSNPTSAAPVANAGPDQSLTLPTSTTTLAGAGTVASGRSLTAYAWSQVGAGPAAVSFSSKTVANPTLSGLTVAGTYTFALVVTDNTGASSAADQVLVTVNPAPTPAPGGTVVYRLNAGGGALSTGRGAFAADQGFSPAPGFTYATTSPIAATPDPALYQTERSAATDQGSFAYALPLANGTYSVVLHFAEIYWTSPAKRLFDVSIEGAKVLDNYDIVQKAGAFTATSETFTTTVSDGALSLYFSALPADGGLDRPKVSAIEVYSTGPTSAAPVANAGPDQSLTLPTSTTTLAGAGTVASGRSLTAYAWSQVGTSPAAASFSSKTVANPTLSGLTVAGTYTFALVVTDNTGASSAADQVVVTVGPAPAPGGTVIYRLNAGGGQVANTIGTFAPDHSFAPAPGMSYTTTAAISGAPDGGTIYKTERYGPTLSYALPVSSGQQYRVVLHFAEIYLSAPGQRLFDVSIEGVKVLDNYDIVRKVGALTATTETFTTTVNDGVLNLYFSSLAADGGVDNAKISAIEVYSLGTGPNPAPVANAGPDQSIMLPTSSTTLAGAGTAASGRTITAYAWSQVGTSPAVASFSSKTVAAPTVSGLTVAGAYTFALVVTDNTGASSAADQVVVTVGPAPAPGGTVIYRLNAGGGALSTGRGAFAADQGFSPTPGFTYATTSPIAATPDPALYQTERSATADQGSFTYALPLANGTYSVVLHFAEIYWTSPAKRLFDVSIEGAKVLDNYDIVQKAGAFTATSETFTTTVSDGALSLYFSALPADGGLDRPKVSAIEVYSTGPTSAAPWLMPGPTRA